MLCSRNTMDWSRDSAGSASPRESSEALLLFRKIMEDRLPSLSEPQAGGSWWDMGGVRMGRG